MVAAAEQGTGGGGDAEPHVLVSSCFAPGARISQGSAIPRSTPGCPSSVISTKPVPLCLIRAEIAAETETGGGGAVLVGEWSPTSSEIQAPAGPRSWVFLSPKHRTFSTAHVPEQRGAHSQIPAFGSGSFGCPAAPGERAPLCRAAGGSLDLSWHLPWSWQSPALLLELPEFPDGTRLAPGSGPCTVASSQVSASRLCWPSCC